MKKRILSMVLAMMLTTSTAVIGANAASNKDIGTGFYASIVNPSMNLALTNDDTENVVARTPNETSSQIWYFERQSNNIYKIKSAKDGNYLDVQTSRNIPCSNVHVHGDGDYTSMRWTLREAEKNGVYIFDPQNTDSVLDINGGTGNVQTWADVTHTAKFEVRKIDYEDIGTGFYASIVNPSMNLALTNDDTENVVARTPNGSSDQTWYFERQDGNIYKIKSVKDGNYLDVQTTRNIPCSNVHVHGNGGYISMLWGVRKVDGGYILAPLNTDSILDINGGTGNVQTWAELTHTAKFEIRRVGDELDEKIENFINDSRWKNGISWGNQTPKLSGAWSSKQCAAYAADFIKYVHGKNSPYAGTKYTSASEIRKGDVLYVTPMHWMCVLERDGNTLRIAEGNISGKVRISYMTLKGNDIYNSNGKYFKTFSCGYHF